jgi:tartrate dehydrogenase/decarboxylase/D-malate dehydrogenase
MFEPVHGSAPDIYGRNVANPLAQIWSGAMMLEHLGHPEAAAAVLRAMERVLVDGPCTLDLGDKASTQELGRAVAEAVLARLSYGDAIDPASRSAGGPSCRFRASCRRS